MVRNLYYDVVIAGCGVAGLYTALSLPEDQKILMLSKEGIENCDSMLAQGGICVMRDEEDYEPYFEDTMKAGHYENRKESVEIMIRSSRGVIDHLLKLGVRFDMNPDGSLNYTRRERIRGREYVSTKILREKKSPRYCKSGSGNCRT